MDNEESLIERLNGPCEQFYYPSKWIQILDSDLDSNLDSNEFEWSWIELDAFKYICGFLGNFRKVGGSRRSTFLRSHFFDGKSINAASEVDLDTVRGLAFLISFVS